MKKVLSIDWLTLNLRGYLRQSSIITFREMAYGTRQFRCVREVFCDGIKIGVLVSDPYLNTLGEDFCQLKIENDLLYYKECFWWIDRFISCSGLRLVNLSRIDFCLDFEVFRNGMSPDLFLQRFAANKYYTLSKCKFALRGVKKESNEYEYLRFGSPSSDVKTILYNKSREMSEVKEKMWIREVWNEVGIGIARDVWRLEFSLGRDNMKFAEKSSGEVFEIDYKSIKSPGVLLKVFGILLHKYFRFIKATDKTNHYREKCLDLIDLDMIKGVKLMNRNGKTIGRSEKIFSNRLVKEINENRRVRGVNHSDVVYWGQTWLLERNLMGYNSNRGDVLKL